MAIVLLAAQTRTGKGTMTIDHAIRINANTVGRVAQANCTVNPDRPASILSLLIAARVAAYGFDSH